VRGYWKQQVNYGKAEALLEMKWPEKYNSFGHLSWQGKIYGPPFGLDLLFQRWRIYHGVWGSGLFQPIYGATPGTLASLPLMPEWYLIVSVLFGISILSILWPSLAVMWPIFVLSVVVQVAQSVAAASRLSFTSVPTGRFGRFRVYALTAGLHLAQPLARLIGRMHYGLTPWRRRGETRLKLVHPRTHTIWAEIWHSPIERLEAIEAALVAKNAVVLRGGDFDNWDLEVRGGLLGGLRTRMAIEEHGGGKQLVRLRSWPVISGIAKASLLLFTALVVRAYMHGIWSLAIIFSLFVVLFGLRALGDSAVAGSTYQLALEGLDAAGQPHTTTRVPANPTGVPPLDESVAS
jgi:hypothetical protein